MDNRKNKIPKIGDVVECIDDRDLDAFGLHILQQGTRYVVRDVKNVGAGACCNSECDEDSEYRTTVYISNIKNGVCWENKERGYKPSRFKVVSKIKVVLV